MLQVGGSGEGMNSKNLRESGGDERGAVIPGSVGQQGNGEAEKLQALQLRQAKTWGCGTCIAGRGGSHLSKCVSQVWGRKEGNTLYMIFSVIQYFMSLWILFG